MAGKMNLPKVPRAKSSDASVGCVNMLMVGPVNPLVEALLADLRTKRCRVDTVPEADPRYVYACPAT